jgi:Holliday junction resolvase
MKKPPLESAVVKSILTRLKSRGGFWFKVYGNPLQVAGLPDIIGCYKGRFVSFEVKRDATKKPSRLQTYYLEKIKEAGGRACVIWTVEQAMQVLQDIEADL